MRTMLEAVSRRSFCRYLTAPVIFWPFMRAIRETQAFGAPGDNKRAIFVFYPSGFANGHFHPDASNNFPRMTQPLTAVKGDVIIPVGINYSSVKDGPDGDRHATGAKYCLTGSPDLKASRSIESHLGEFFKNQSKIPQLRLGVGTGKNSRTGEYSMSFQTDGSLSVIMDNPSLVFRQIYGNGEANGNATATLQKSLIDQNLLDLKRLQASLGSIEKQKVEQHIEAVREMERRLAKGATPGAAGQCPPAPTIPPEFNPNTADGPRLVLDDGRMPQVADLMVDLCIDALACGITKVVYLQFAFPVCYSTFLNTNQPHHEISHYFDASEKVEKFIQCQSFYMGKIANIVSKAKAITEGDKSMLYNTALLAVSEHGDTTSHSKDNLGVVLAGQAGGAWKTGRYVNAGGQSHNKILVSILQAMGMPDNSFGRNDITGGLAALSG